MPEPFHDPFRRLYVNQNQQIAEHARVALNGYGGDGVLTGQSWPYLLYLIRVGISGILLEGLADIL